MSELEMDVDVDDEFNDEEPKNESTSKQNTQNLQQEEPSIPSTTMPELPVLTRKDKTLQEVLDLMDGDYAPIIPDSVTDYYLAKNGFTSSDVKLKRLLSLATQKFILDIAQDAYEYLRIRNASAVYNSSNPQARAKQLLQGQQYANQQLMTGTTGATVDGDGPQQPSSSTAGSQQGKIVLTMDDLSSALAEYGVNVPRPEFYR